MATETRLINMWLGDPEDSESRGLRSYSEDALLATNYASDFVFRGKTFSFSRIFPISNGGVLEILFDPTALTNYNLVVYPPSYVTNGGAAKIEIYAGTTVSANGTEIATNNRNFEYGSPLTKAYSGPTVTANGTLFSQFLCPGGKFSGNSITDTLEFVPNVEVKYLFRITNLDTQDIDFNLQMVWFEI